MSRIAVDLETIPDQRPGAFERYLEDVKPPGNYKKPDTIQAWMAENAETIAGENYLKTSLSGLHGEICAIGYAFDDELPVSLVREQGQPEKELLLAFYAVVLDRAKAGEGKYQRLQWVGHNVLEFDLRFLKQRTLVSIGVPPVMIPTEARHGSDMVFDTMKEWAGLRGYVKQSELCEVFGIDPGDGMTGADIWPAWQAGEYQRIQDYNVGDVAIVQALYRRMVGFGL